MRSDTSSRGFDRDVLRPTLCFCVACFVGMQAAGSDLNEDPLVAEDYASAEGMDLPCDGCGRLAATESDGSLTAAEIHRYNAVLDEAFGREGNLPSNFPWYEEDEIAKVTNTRHHGRNGQAQLGEVRTASPAD